MIEPQHLSDHTRDCADSENELPQELCNNENDGDHSSQDTECDEAVGIEDRPEDPREDGIRGHDACVSLSIAKCNPCAA